MIGAVSAVQAWGRVAGREAHIRIQRAEAHVSFTVLTCPSVCACTDVRVRSILALTAVKAGSADALIPVVATNWALEACPAAARETTGLIHALSAVQARSDLAAVYVDFAAIATPHRVWLDARFHRTVTYRFADRNAVREANDHGIRQRCS